MWRVLAFIGLAAISWPLAASAQTSLRDSPEDTFRQAYSRLSYLQVSTRVETVFAISPKLRNMPEMEKRESMAALVDFFTAAQTECRMRMLQEYPQDVRERMYQEVAGAGSVHLMLSALMEWPMQSSIIPSFNRPTDAKALKVYGDCTLEKKKSMSPELSRIGF